MILTSNDIVLFCQQLGALSSNQAGLGTTDFLRLTNLVMMSLTSELLQAAEEYLIYQEAIPVTAGNGVYRVPYRSVNTEVRHLWFEDSTGARTRLFGRTIEDVENYTASTVGYPDSFYLMGNSLVLLPTPNVGGNLQIAYPFRPNQLVDQSTCQQVSAVASPTITVPNLPTNFVTGALYDIIDHRSGNNILYYDMVGTVSGNSVTFNSAIPNAAVGNWVALAGQSPVPMLPEEGHGLLLETVVMRIEMLRGNAARVKNSGIIIQDARKAWNMLLLNRIVSKPKAAGSGGQLPSRPW
jgi:hypothetical protein